MGSAKSVDVPDDPDPTPIVSGESNAEVQQAGRQQRKKMAKNYGRAQTVLAGHGDQSAGAEQKKTVLGG